MAISDVRASRQSKMWPAAQDTGTKVRIVAWKLFRFFLAQLGGRGRRRARLSTWCFWGPSGRTRGPFYSNFGGFFFFFSSPAR